MSQEDWEHRYQTHDMPWEKGAPSPGLVDFLATHRDLTGETVCVPGCGTGHDVREWAKAGFRAYGYDLAPSAVRLGTQWTCAAGFRGEFTRGGLVGRGRPAPLRADGCALAPRALRLGSEWTCPAGLRAEFRRAAFLREAPPFPFDW